MDEQEINIAKDTAAPRVECFWKAPWDIYVDFLGKTWVKTFATILLHFFLKTGKFYAVFCTYEGRAGGLKLFLMWDLSFPKSSNYNTICSKLRLNSQLPQSCRHCFPNQHQQVRRWDLCHPESLYSSLKINKQHIFQALKEKGYV